MYLNSQVEELPDGKTPHISKVRANAKNGEKAKIFLWEEFLGIVSSLINSFTASAKGCRSPPNLTLFGPFRDCLSPKIFRSIKVKKATLINTGIIKVSHSKVQKNIMF